MQKLMVQIDNYERVLEIYGKDHIWKNGFGLARSILAMGTLITLVVNKTIFLFPTINGTAANSLLEIVKPKYNFFLLIGFGNVHFMHYLAIIILFIAVLGYFPRYICLLHWWICYSFAAAASAVDGGDQIASNLSLLIVPICLLDSRKNHFAPSIEIITENRAISSLFAKFCYFFIRLQAAVVYLHAATEKFKVEEWINGTAAYYWLSHTFFCYPNWAKFIVEPLLRNPISVSIITWGTIILELCLFAGLFMDNKYKKVFLTLGIAFHFVILLLHGLVSFFFSMAALLLLYLYPINQEIDFKPLYARFNNIKNVRIF
jgi:antimicrobial peptide system SdpB family protein